MKKKNILILAYESELFNTIAAAKILEKKYNITFFCCDWFSSLSEINKKKIQESGIKHDIIFDIKKEILELNKLSDKDIIKINYKYITDIENSLLSEKILHIGSKDFTLNYVDTPRLHYYHTKNKNILIKYYEIILKKFENVINFKNYQLIYSAGTSNLIRNIFLSYCRKKKVPFFSPKFRLSLTYLSECSTCSSNIKYLFQKKFLIQKKNDFKYKKSNLVFNKSNLINIFSLLNSLSKLFNNFFGLVFDDFKIRIKFIRPNYFYEKNRLWLIYYTFQKSFRKFLIQKYVLQNLKNKIRIIKKNKFIYFPLHIIPEGGVFDQNDYMDESFLIYEISKLIPADYKILVKIHPDLLNSGESVFPLSWYKKIGELPNVEILPQNINNYFLLKHCKTTVSISGTSSIECAVFYNKTSFVVGDIELIGVKNLLKYNKEIFKKFINGRFNLKSESKIKNCRYNMKIFNLLKSVSINYENNDNKFLKRKKKNKDSISKSQNFYNNLIFPSKEYSETKYYKKIMEQLLKRIL